MAVQKATFKRRLDAVKVAAFAYKDQLAMAWQQRAAAEARAAEIFFAHHERRQGLEANKLELANVVSHLSFQR